MKTWAHALSASPITLTLQSSVSQLVEKSYIQTVEKAPDAWDIASKIPKRLVG